MIETLGLYKILDRIGAGAMGDVYRARDTRLGRTVAITVLSPDIAGHPGRRERFVSEARVVATLSHPNIAALYEVGDEQGRLFLVCEFVPGETLRTVTSGRPMNPRRAIDLAVQIGDALADAHAQGLLHADLRPLRTVAYMSPEQALGEQVDQRTDIFSLGTVLFEMLTGALPFTATTSSALALQIVQAPAPAPSSVRKSLPQELDVIVGKALAKSLEQRYEAAATFAAELRSVAAILDVRNEGSEPASTLIALQRPQRSYVGWIVGSLRHSPRSAGR